MPLSHFEVTGGARPSVVEGADDSRAIGPVMVAAATYSVLRDVDVTDMFVGTEAAPPVGAVAAVIVSLEDGFGLGMALGT